MNKIAYRAKLLIQKKINTNLCVFESPVELPRLWPGLALMSWFVRLHSIKINTAGPSLYGQYKTWGRSLYVLRWHYCTASLSLKRLLMDYNHQESSKYHLFRVVLHLGKNAKGWIEKTPVWYYVYRRVKTRTSVYLNFPSCGNVEKSTGSVMEISSFNRKMFV